MALSQTAVNSLRDAFGPRLQLDEPLHRHTSARIGGPADGYIEAYSADELSTAARIAWAQGVPLFVLGGGSNILISDRGVRGLVVLNEAKKLAITQHTAIVESGYSTIQLARRLAKQKLTGFEWAIGVPGTVGGAIYGNAGAHGGDMSQCVESADAITPDGPVTYSSQDLDFEYRASSLKRERRKAVILSAKLKFKSGDAKAINAKMEEYNDYRKRTQPGGATIGSMFKNPPGDFAGRLIEAAGLKGKRLGGAEISTVHANFFVNAGNATAQDVMALVDLAREQVKAQSGVTLEMEIEPVGEW